MALKIKPVLVKVLYLKDLNIGAVAVMVTAESLFMCCILPTAKIYNSDVAKAYLNLRTAHNSLISAYNDLVYGLAIGFTNGGNNDGWPYMGIDDFKFSVDAAAAVNTEIAGFNTPVPVPIALPLFLSGLLTLGLSKDASFVPAQFDKRYIYRAAEL